MSHQQQRQQQLFLEDLPNEVLLQIYRLWVLTDSNMCLTTKNFGGNHSNRKYKFSVSSRRYHQVTSVAKHGVYEEALIEHLITHVPVITANIKDLSFANLKPFLSLLRTRDQLTLFERYHGNARFPPRQIRIRHIITKKFPKDADKVIAFAAWVDNKLYGPNSPSLYTESSVAEGEGSEATESFFRTIGLMGTYHGGSALMEEITNAIEEYAMEEHVGILARQRARNAVHEQVARTLFTVRDEEV